MLSNQQKILIRLLKNSEQKDMFCFQMHEPPVAGKWDNLNIAEITRSFENEILSALSIPSNLINPPQQYGKIKNKQDLIDLFNLLDREERR